MKVLSKENSQIITTIVLKFNQIMFSKNNPNQPVSQTKIEDIIEENVPESVTEKLDLNQQKTVKLVEKISSILSPYFIVIVGLYLYENNFFLGTILILVGIFSLLKISYEDIWQWVEKIKSLFK